MRLKLPLIFEKAPGDWQGDLLSLSVFRHASIAVSFHFTPRNLFPYLPFSFFLPVGWLSFFYFFLSLSTFPFSYFSLTYCQAVFNVQYSRSSLVAVFMWQMPDLLKAGALTKKRTNDRERCQSNTQAFQRCKQMCACTKGHFSEPAQRKCHLFSLSAQTHTNRCIYQTSF